MVQMWGKKPKIYVSNNKRHLLFYNSQLIVNGCPSYREMHDGKAKNLFQLVLSCQHSIKCVSMEKQFAKKPRKTQQRGPKKDKLFVFVLLYMVSSNSRC